MKTERFGRRERLVYGSIREAIKVPNLIEIQTSSYKWFLEHGIMEVLNKFSPIRSQPHRGDLRKQEKGFVLEFVHTKIGEPKENEGDCKAKGTSFSVPLHVTVRISDINTNEMREEEAFFGYIPFMTERGSFIINGAERVVVNQLVRSPGIYFVDEPNTPGARPIYVAHFLPQRGAWLEIMLNPNKHQLQARIDRRRKVNLLLFLKAVGFVIDSEFFSYFPMEVEIFERKDLETYEGAIVLDEIKNADGETLIAPGEKLVKKAYEPLLEAGIEKITILNPYIQKTYESLGEDLQKATEDEAVMELFRKLKPGEIPRVNTAKNYLYNLYFSEEKYDFSEVGRYKMNRRLDTVYDQYLRFQDKSKKPSTQKQKYEEESQVIKKMDLLLATMHLLDLERDPNLRDTKDHLGNKRVRTVGELLQSEFERGFVKIQKLIQEKLTIYNTLDKVSVQSLINVRPIIIAMNQFFASSQLSQFMDQVNPLSELTNKRRLSSIGPGGLKRERAKIEVRDVHDSHYGRMCPIETPEGANIGLITSLSTFATIDRFGFLITPYSKVEKGKVTEEIVFLTADQEESYKIAQANTPVAPDGTIMTDRVVVRFHGDIRYEKKEDVQFKDVSPKQMISISTALIPFLEHDDSNRALMGSNMQRQGVPLLDPQAPRVGTGVEWVAARDSGYVVLAKYPGQVSKVDAKVIEIHRADANDRLIYEKKQPVIDVYRLAKFQRSNQDTLINQHAIVKAGDWVKTGDPIADGPATDMGELALGKNILVAFMPWEGYNFEDAILVNENLLARDTFTSIHVEMYEVNSRETRLGAEEITPDIPNVSKERLKNLDENGVVRVGAFVSSEDILVGKVTPKGEAEISPEEKIIRSVFGDRGRDIQDTSLKVPHGVSGRVIDVKVYNKSEVAELGPGVNQMIRVYVACRKPLDIGDKLAGRHGNKGVVSKILPCEEMPFLPDGMPVDMVLSPLGVPSRMNLGQILETHLGWLSWLKNVYVATPVFDGAKENEVLEELFSLRQKQKIETGDEKKDPTGKVLLRDGRSGLTFDQPIVVGIMYMMKLVHIAQDKIHARSVGPYSLIHQQPLGGKAQFGGQRFGEMEVWALEAFGATHTLNEMLTIKSDDVVGRNEVYKAILKNKNIPETGVPESFKVLIKELRGVVLDTKVFDENGNEINLDRD
ncbi:MAG: DNA-directed RNA polymerase subunit beta [Thermotogota bacterium]